MPHKSISWLMGIAPTVHRGNTKQTEYAIVAVMGKLITGHIKNVHVILLLICIGMAKYVSCVNIHNIGILGICNVRIALLNKSII